MPYAHRLRLFVEDCRLAGRTRQQVLTALRRYGWTEEEIDMAFAEWCESGAAARAA